MTDKKTFVLFAGLLLVFVNAVTSGELAYLWGTISGANTSAGPIPTPNPGQTVPIPGGTITGGSNGGYIVGQGTNYSTGSGTSTPYVPKGPRSAI